MIEVTVYERHAEARIVKDPGRKFSKEKFTSDLNRLKSDIPYQNRKWNPDKKVWVITGFAKFNYLPYMADAMDARKRQLSLF